MKTRTACIGLLSLAAISGIGIADAGAMMKTGVKVPDVDIPDISIPRVPRAVPDANVPRAPNAPNNVTAPPLNAPNAVTPPPSTLADPTARPMPVPPTNAPNIATPAPPAVNPSARPMPVPPAQTASPALPDNVKPAANSGAATTTRSGRVLPQTPPKKTPAAADSASASTSGSASTSSGAVATKPADAKAVPGKLTKKWPPAEAAVTPMPDGFKRPPGAAEAATTPVEAGAAKPKRLLPAAPEKKIAPSESASASTSTRAPKTKPDADVQYGALPADKQYTTIPPEPATVDPNAVKALRTGHAELPARPEMLPAAPGAKAPTYDTVPDAPTKQYVGLPPEGNLVDPNASKVPAGHNKLPAANYGELPNLDGTPPEVKATPARKLGEKLNVSPEDIARAEQNKLGLVAAPGVGLPAKPQAAATTSGLPNRPKASPAAASGDAPPKPPKSSKPVLTDDNDALVPAQAAATPAVRRVRQMPAPQAVASAAPSVAPSQVVGRRQLQNVQGGAVNNASSSGSGIEPGFMRQFY